MLVLHTTAGWQKQPSGVWTTGGNLMDFFRGPKKLDKKNKDGTHRVWYKGEEWYNQAALPDERLEYSGIHVRKAYPHGNGWIKGGYNKLIEGSGKVFVAYPDEVMTNGINPSPDGKYSNRNTLHINWIGGVVKRHGKIVYADDRTKAQKNAMAGLVFEYLAKYPEILVAGHYQLNRKVCPLFNATEWLEEIGVPAERIYRPDPWGIGKSLK